MNVAECQITPHSGVDKMAFSRALKSKDEGGGMKDESVFHPS
jgi:hypothetical protein